MADKEPLGLDCDSCLEEIGDGTVMDFVGRVDGEALYRCPVCGYEELGE